jgi:hypothetical protein
LQHTFLNIHHVSGYRQTLYNYPQFGCFSTLMFALLSWLCSAAMLDNGCGRP